MSTHVPVSSATAGANTSQWYAVQTRSNFEKRVVEDLRLKGLESFLPAIREYHRWKDRKKLVEVPVFPGYVFVNFSASPREQLTVLNTPGAARILGLGGNPEPIPSTEIDAIRILVASGCPFSQYPFLKEGAKVVVTRGPLRGISGILLKFRNSSRMVLSITLLSQSVAAEVDSSDVAVLNPNRYGVIQTERGACIQI